MSTALKLLVILSLFLLSYISNASVDKSLNLLPVTVNLHNQASLQRGAKLFMNYCSGCHSLKYLRYNRLGVDLGITNKAGEVDEILLKNNLIFTQAQISDPIITSLPPLEAKNWFGIVPPDLSLIARIRSPQWLYNYLLSFYTDKSRPFHTNNLLIPNVAMPNVLAPLRGQVIITSGKLGTRLVKRKPGLMDEAEFREIVMDLVNFLTYASEPVKFIRYRLGIIILIFLSILLIVIYKLKKIYWRQLIIKE